MYKPAVKKFMEYYSISKSIHTIYCYQKYIKYFFRWYQKAPVHVTKRDLIRYFSLIKKEGKSSTNINLSKHSLKSYFKFLNNIASREFLSLSIFDNIDNPKIEYRTQKVVSYADILPILKYLKKETDAYLRTRSLMIILIFATTGARKLEVSNLKLENINIESGCIQFMRTKRNKPRINSIPPITIKYIKRYLRLRSEIVNKNNNRLLVSKVDNNSKYSSLGIVQTLYTCIKKDFPNFTLHAMRRGYALDLYNNGVELAKVSKALGHSDFNTTVKCYLLFKDRDLEKSVSNHPAYIGGSSLL